MDIPTVVSESDHLPTTVPSPQPVKTTVNQEIPTTKQQDNPLPNDDVKKDEKEKPEDEIVAKTQGTPHDEKNEDSIVTEVEKVEHAPALDIPLELDKNDAHISFAEPEASSTLDSAGKAVKTETCLKLTSEVIGNFSEDKLAIEASKQIAEKKPEVKAVDTLSKEKPASENASEVKPAAENVHEEKPGIEDVQEEKSAVEYVREHKTAVEDLQDQKPAVVDAQEEKPTLKNVQEQKPVVEDLQEHKPAVVYVPEEKPGVEDIQEEKPTVENIQEEKPAVEEVQQERPTVEDVRELKTAVEDVQQEKPTVENIQEEKPAVEDVPDLKIAVEDVQQEKPTVEDMQEEKPAIKDVKLQEEKPAVEEMQQEKPAVEEMQQEKPTVVDVRDEKPAIKDIQELNPTVENIQVEKPAVEDVQEEKPTVEDVQKDKTVAEDVLEEKPVFEDVTEEKPAAPYVQEEKPAVEILQQEKTVMEKVEDEIADKPPIETVHEKLEEKSEIDKLEPISLTEAVEKLVDDLEVSSPNISEPEATKQSEKVSTVDFKADEKAELTDMVEDKPQQQSNIIVEKVAVVEDEGTKPAECEGTVVLKEEKIRAGQEPPAIESSLSINEEALADLKGEGKDSPLTDVEKVVNEVEIRDVAEGFSKEETMKTEEKVAEIKEEKNVKTEKDTEEKNVKIEELIQSERTKDEDMNGCSSVSEKEQVCRDVEVVKEKEDNVKDNLHASVEKNNDTNFVEKVNETSNSSTTGGHIGSLKDSLLNVEEEETKKAEINLESTKEAVDEMKPDHPAKEDDDTNTSRDAPTQEVSVKPAQKSSGNIMSKVKQSIVKVKKAIIRKSPSSKTMQNEAEGSEKVH